MSQRLGQYFLKNEQALRALVDALHVTPEDTIIEIGPGHGELTEHLLASPAAQIIAIEKDHALAQHLQTQIQDSRFKIQDGDALKILPQLVSTLNAQRYTLVGNIPYYITGFLFRTIGELEHKPTRAVFTIQKEVAERICAAPPAFNKLAASVQVWAEPRIIMTLQPQDFEPAPEVESAIIELKNQNAKIKINEGHLKKYYRMVHILFRQPRKTIINNLMFGFPDTPKETLLAALAQLDIPPTDRPQNLSVEKILQFPYLIKY